MKRTAPFPYGQIITPDRDVIGYYLEEFGRKQMCVDEDLLQRLDQQSNLVDCSLWKRGPWVCRRDKWDITRVSRTHYGWRALCRIQDSRPNKFASPHILGYALANIPVLFPMAEAAIIAAELFSSGQNWDIAPMAWIPSSGGTYRICKGMNTFKIGSPSPWLSKKETELKMI